MWGMFQGVGKWVAEGLKTNPENVVTGGSREKHFLEGKSGLEHRNFGIWPKIQKIGKILTNESSTRSTPTISGPKKICKKCFFYYYFYCNLTKSMEGIRNRKNPRRTLRVRNPGRAGGCSGPTQCCSAKKTEFFWDISNFWRIFRNETEGN